MPKKKFLDYLGNEFEELAVPFNAGYALGTLWAAKKEMDRKNIIGSDDFYHTAGMHEAARRGAQSAAAGFIFSLLKEGYDILRKSSGIGIKRQNIWSVLEDTRKDMSNNIKGMISGFVNPRRSGRKLWQDLFEER